MNSSFILLICVNYPAVLLLGPSRYKQTFSWIVVGGVALAGHVSTADMHIL